jgi:hypothetical protein
MSARKVAALDPRERNNECDHPFGFAYAGIVPCTGHKVCYLCLTKGEEN